HQWRYGAIDGVRDGPQQLEFSRANGAVGSDRANACTQEKPFCLRRCFGKLIERGFDGRQCAFGERQESELRALVHQLGDTSSKRGLRFLRRILSCVSQSGEQGRTGGRYSLDRVMPNFGFRRRFEARLQVPTQHLLQGEFEQIQLLIRCEQLGNVCPEGGVLRQRQPAQCWKRQVDQRNFDQFIQRTDGGQHRIDL